MKTFWVLASFIAGSSVIATHNYTDNNTEKNRSKNSAPVGTVYILIDKSDYELSLYDEKGWYATYPVVFGNSSLSDKKMEGDKKYSGRDFSHRFKTCSRQMAPLYGA